MNFGAPGDRRSPDGTLWLEYPSVGGKSPDVPIYLWSARFFTAYYFLFFIVLMPIVGVLETPKPMPRSITEAVLGKGIKGLKFGIPKEYRLDGMAPEIDKLWQQGIAWLKAAGAEPVDISLPHTKHALPAYYIIAPAEASSNLDRKSTRLNSSHRT